MKRSTRIHLMVARENVLELMPEGRRSLAATLRYYRKHEGANEARRIHRRIYGPLIID